MTNPLNSIDTNKKLANIAGVKPTTYKMGAKVLNSDNDDLKQRVLSGETSISAGYKELTQKKLKRGKEKMKYPKEKYKNMRHFNDMSIVERAAYLRQQKIIEKLKNNKNIKSDESLKCYYNWLNYQRLIYRKNQMRKDRRKMFEQAVMKRE